VASQKSMVAMRYDLHVVGHDVVLCEIHRWRFVTLFEYSWISRFKKSSVLAPDRRSDCMLVLQNVYGFPCPTTWRPEQLA